MLELFESQSVFTDIEDYKKDLGIEEVHTAVEKTYTNAFFTEKACRKHIEANYYHYNNPVSYLKHAFRNDEMKLVMKFLCELSGGELHL